MFNNKLLSKLRIILDYSKKAFRICLKLFKQALKLLLLFLILLILEPSLDTLFELLNTGKIFEFGVSVVAPLAALISFSSLMYSRTRALNSKAQQFRSLYIAERLMSAATYYLMTLLITFICYQLSTKYHFNFNLRTTVGANPMALIIFVPLYFFMGFCIELFFAIHGLDFNISGRRPKFVAPKIKKLLKTPKTK